MPSRSRTGRLPPRRDSSRPRIQVLGRTDNPRLPGVNRALHSVFSAERRGRTRRRPDRTKKYLIESKHRVDSAAIIQLRARRECIPFRLLRQTVTFDSLCWVSMAWLNVVVGDILRFRFENTQEKKEFPATWQLAFFHPRIRAHDREKRSEKSPKARGTLRARHRVLVSTFRVLRGNRDSAFAEYTHPRLQRRIQPVYRRVTDSYILIIQHSRDAWPKADGGCRCVWTRTHTSTGASSFKN